MNNLLLGGAGFIGQNLAHKLLKTRMERVTIIDNLATSRINLDDFAEYKNLFKFVEADLTNMDSAELLAHMKDNNRIFHLAGSVGVEHIDRHPSETLFNNIALSNKLIPLFQQAKRHVVFASTSEIYGEGPFSEESNASIGPSSKLRWGYATAKLMTEFMLRACTFPHNTVRFFNVVGPGQVGDYGMVLPRFINAAKAGEDLIVYGSGEQVRSFCHIKDALDALVKVSTTPGELYNIGNDEPMTINQLAQRVIELSGSTSKIVHVPYEQAFSKHHGDINKRVPDLTKIRTNLNYSPKYNLDDIIKDML
jgi:UDP-glucose 4-epimerase